MTYTQAKRCLEETDRDNLEELIDRFGEALIVDYVEGGYSLSNMEEGYQGEYNSDEEFAQSMADELGLTNKELSWPYTCIDWEYAAKELMYDYFEVNGHYFRNL